MAEPIRIRRAEARDRDDFLSMWADFVALAPDEPGNHSIGEVNWARIVDPSNSLVCIVAVNDDDKPVGFTLYLTFPFTWSRGDACYLQDIFVRPQARGRGVAQAMIAHLRRTGEAEGWFKVFWMTQHDNFDAQRVYDKVAKRMNYLRYDLNVSEP